MTPRRLSALLLPLALLLAGSSPALAEVLREESVELYRLAPGARVEIANVNGDLELTSWDRDEAQVEVTKVVKTLGHARAAQALDELRVEVRHTPDELVLKTRQPRRTTGISAWLVGGHIQARVTYRVTLPRTVRLEAATVNGDVLIDAVTGPIVARTVNGQIDIEAAASGATASTTNGNIRAEFLDLAGGGEIALRTTNGGIVAYVPAAAGVDIDASTVNGAVNTDFAVLADGSSATWRRKSLRGAINGGGTQVTLETVNGSIQLRTHDGA